MEMQERLEQKGIKVLSLFFIDRVANYTSPRRHHPAHFRRRVRQAASQRYPFYAGMNAAEVRSAYFAKAKPEKGEGEGQAMDTDSRNAGGTRSREGRLRADHERQGAPALVSMEDGQACFIFAHSALKEGWDNPNVFQICTLNQTVSEMKKRQEIGRGLRLAVNQDGQRVFDDEVNILSVVANESYQSYAASLQTEYIEAGQAPPPKPTNAGRTKAKRNDQIFNETQAFRDFWAKLQRQAAYRIQVDTPALVEACVERLNNRPSPQSVIVIEKGTFVVTEYQIELLSVSGEKCKLRITTQNTLGDNSQNTHTFELKTDLAKALKDDRLRGYQDRTDCG